MKEESLLQITDLKKSYSMHTVFETLSFSIEKKHIYALLGENGAGKSTLIHILCGCESFDSGTIHWKKSGNSCSYKKEIGVVFQNDMLDHRLTVAENLLIRGGISSGKTIRDSIYRFLNQNSSLEDIYGISRQLAIFDLLDKPYGILSGGQKRRCDIARALIHNPQILFLDEPTRGLDPMIRSSLWESLLDIQKKTDLTIFMATHYMDEAALSDRLLLLIQNQLITRQTPFALKKYYIDHEMSCHTLEDIYLNILEGRNPFAVPHLS